MFIELAEFLRCPKAHDPDPYLVLVGDTMTGRHVAAGRVACPVCRSEYPITSGVARFGELASPAATSLPDADVVHTLLGLGGPGGYVVLVGSAALLAASLAERMVGIHFVGVNSPSEAATAPTLSHVQHPSVLPLKTSMARGVVVGPEHCTPAWLGESARVLLKGLRLVALQESSWAVDDVEELAVGKGMWLAEKR